MNAFLPADILMPKTDHMEKWAVIACDQFTSDQAYWDRVRKNAEGAVSTINLILPEAELGTEMEAEHTAVINKTMADYMKNDVFTTYPNSYVYVERTLENGLALRRVRVPMGVIAIIYESRPNVTSDAAALALKSGNVCVLRSGREAYRSAAAITAALRRGLERTGLTPDLVNLVEDTSHAGAAALMTATGYVDLLIPRGGAGLIRACVEHATVPCIQTGTGICHIYVDERADLDMALDIIENAKTSRPSVCNAAEVLLVHRAIAPRFLPMLQKRLCGPGAKHPVRLRCDEEAAAILGIAPDPEFDTEFLDYVLAVGVVDGVEGAIRHIAQHSTHHSEAIVTQSEESAARFTAGVDSAAVYVNASTRFTDGGEFGLGCEMGISTQKLHARGPIGLNELTTYQYVITGNGQIRR